MSTSRAEIPIFRDPATFARDLHSLHGVSATSTVALVPTMGALHKGHLSLVKKAKKFADIVVVSVFVNPLQFAPSEDFLKYPRTLEADAAHLAKAGATAVFAPEATAMYTKGASTTVHAGPVAHTFEGSIRPTHFDGVLTVLAKLFNIVRPEVAVFGQKDAQQVFLVRRMVADLNFPIRVETGGIVRDEDGLALSSRNEYLSSDERQSALTLHTALRAAKDNEDLGVDEAVRAAQAVFVGEPLAKLDYLTVVDPTTFTPVPTAFHGEALMIVAAKVGSTRLIDNQKLHC